MTETHTHIYTGALLISKAAEFLMGHIPLTSLTQGSRIDIEEGKPQPYYTTTDLLKRPQSTAYHNSEAKTTNFIQYLTLQSFNFWSKTSAQESLSSKKDISDCLTDKHLKPIIHVKSM